MKIRSLSLKNFRVYPELKINIDSDLVFFTGQNGLGKTSILEALSIGSTLKSFRNARDKDIILWQETFYSVDINFENNLGNNSVQIGYGAIGNEPPERRLFFDKQRINTISNFIGKFKTVVFSPNDINIIDTSPKERRGFFDLVLSSIYPEYLISLQRYIKSLKIRSQVLRVGKIDQNYLESIDREISILGSFLANKRLSFLEKFQPVFQSFISQISKNQDHWKIEIQGNQERIKNPDNYFQALRETQKNDFRMNQTTFGIHRDKFIFQPALNRNLDLKQVASQGQKRTVALALKMAQFVVTRQLTSSTPVLLIDDVLNELDVERRKRFIEFLHQIGQAWITTTDVESIKDYLEYHSSAVETQFFEIHSVNKEAMVKEV